MKKRLTYDLSTQLISAVLVWLRDDMAISKLSDFHGFKNQMHKQVFGKRAAELLNFMLYGVELFTAAFFRSGSSRKFGVLSSILILLLFIVYHSFIPLHDHTKKLRLRRSVLQSIGWPSHLLFYLACPVPPSFRTWLSFKRKEVSA
ncbi:MauE/DoxX family redox-associated membrane protein [Pedobacter sp. BMA]|uniref:MauE/DoxX family redox-associated membrane protein n=1 Tax=Pedobacter sp. BMA TaxID=1663685 RepID=UPI00064A81DC|nr:MauE/DoxX family redox-associated membrane protein [Pedobacter sp. BMA]KLT63913.1 hypothetical protein AB669_19480 [Pedobacter sp. BMA]